MAGAEPVPPSSPWLTVRQAAAYAQCGPRLIYRAVADSKLRAARINGRRDLRLRPEWVDEFLAASAKPVEIGR